MTAIHRFTLKRPCGHIRPFNHGCINSFASDGCAGSVACGSATSNLCLTPTQASGECDRCGIIGPAGINNLQVPAHWPSSWNGSFGVNPYVSNCQWLGFFPEAEVAGTYADPAHCNNPYFGSGDLIGKYIYDGSLGIIKGGIDAFFVYVGRNVTFEVTVEPEGLPRASCIYQLGSRINLWWLSEVKSLGYFIVNETCRGTFSLVPNSPPGSASADSVSM